jgi:phosphoglycolate phosphatase
MRFVVFDCDGTLVDSQHLIAMAMNETFDNHGMARPKPHHIKRIVGLSLEEAVKRLVPDAGVGDINNLVARFKIAYQTQRVDLGHEENLFDGIRETLEWLNGNDYLVGVATGNSTRGLRRILETHELTHYFLNTQTADQHPSKPNPAMLFSAMNEVGVTPNQTILVGDTSFDMTMAKNAKVDGLGVTWGYHEDHELIEAGAKKIVDDPQRLVQAIENMYEG